MHSYFPEGTIETVPQPLPQGASPPLEAPGAQDGIEVHADDRERGQPVMAALQALPFVRTQVRRLKVGDYQVGSRLLVERKTAADFVASIIDGRLFQQASLLSRGPEEGVIILEGSGRQLADAGMTRQAIQGALITLKLVFHLPVLRSVDPAETAWLIVCAGRQLLRREQDLPSRGGRRPKRRRRAQLRILQGLPFVGPTRAGLLLDRFGSVRAVFSASPQEWMSVDGIAEKTAAAMEWALR